MNRLRRVLRFLPGSLVHFLCTCGPVGYWGKAPGTLGSLIGLGLYATVFFPLGLWPQLLLTGVLAGVTVLICDEGERRLQKRDPGEMVLDEVVAVPLCFWGLQGSMAETGGTWLYLLAGFTLFRLYDIAKPLGIKKLQDLPGGLGVVLDDLAAAVAVNLTLRLFLFAYAHGAWG